MPNYSSPQERRFHERIEQLMTWASSTPTVAASVAAGSTASLGLISSYAMVTFNVTYTTATNYAHVVIANLSATSSGSNFTLLG